MLTIKTWRFGDDVPPLTNANQRDYETIYIGKEGAKHNIKFEEQKNEIIKRKVLLTNETVCKTVI